MFDKIFLINLLSSIITGLVSGLLVAIYFENRQNKKHKLSHAHILDRFINNLFSNLTIIRVSTKLPPPQGTDARDILKILEETLGRKNPPILISKILNLTLDERKYIYNQLILSKQTLTALFSDSIAHKTVDGKVSASIAEIQKWIDGVLSNYDIFPEIFSGEEDKFIKMHWMNSILNLTENSFAILNNMLILKNTPNEMLHWGSRI